MIRLCCHLHPKGASWQVGVRSMAEVGLVGFARVVLDAARCVLLDYRSNFSKSTSCAPSESRARKRTSGGVVT
jgi:hypothetical protein